MVHIIDMQAHTVVELLLEVISVVVILGEVQVQVLLAQAATTAVVDTYIHYSIGKTFIAKPMLLLPIEDLVTCVSISLAPVYMPHHSLDRITARLV